MAATDPTRCFFLHVMKTGGTTFLRQLGNEFPAPQRYPFLQGEERRLQYTMVDELRTLSPETLRKLRMFSGHFPFVASRIVEPDATITILRDPIERTVSILRHFRRGSAAYRDAPLEVLYEHPLIFPLFIRDYQAKLFAMTEADHVDSHRDVIEVDAARLRIAKDNLERVDVVGLADHHDQFLEQLGSRFGWHFTAGVPNQRVSREGWTVSQSLRRRIAADNPAEMEFYEHALALHTRAQHERRRSA